MSSPALSLATSPLPSDAEIIRALTEAIGENEDRRSPEDLTRVNQDPPVLPEPSPPIYFHDIDQVDPFSDPFGSCTTTHEYPVPPTILRWRAEQAKQGYIKIQTDTCWRCGQTGHRRDTCHDTPVLFCSRCGKRDTLSRNCPCQKKSEEVRVPTIKRLRQDIPVSRPTPRRSSLTPCPTCGCPNGNQGKPTTI